jgi:hypothetical protein
MARCYTGPPMDLQNMRSLGVVHVDAFCACGWQASVDVSPLPDELVCRMFGCGSNAPSAAPGRPKPARIGPNTNTGQSIGVSEVARIRPIVGTSPPNLGPAFAILPAEDRPWRPTLRFAV